MRNEKRFSRLLQIVALITAQTCVFAVDAARAQVTGGADVNVSRLANYQNECAIIKNPSNHLQLFAACNNAGPGLFAARSNDHGATWTFPDPVDRTLADGDPGQGALACCDPTLAWDTFGNLYFGYLDSTGANVVVLISTDSGATFNNLATFAGSVDQPTVVAANTSAPGAPVAVWVVWNQGGQMVARGAAVTGLGVANVGAFNALQTIPGTANCSFGDIAIAPGGAVVQACETPTGGQGPATILVNTDADGLGPGNFGAAVAATTTNVGGFDFIPSQNVRSVDAEAGLAFDSNNGNPMSPHFGRLYLVYTEEPVDESNDTDIMLRFSDNNGATWSNPPIRVNDDVSGRSQFLPKIAVNPLSGNVGICWHDARNSAGNNTMQVFCTIATRIPATPNFMPNAQISGGTSTGTGGSPPTPGTLDIQFGDYSGMTYFQGRVHPIWADNSNSTGDNPDTARYDAYTDLVMGGPAAMEGDTHITTVNKVHYDFQGAGEFISLRDGDGTEIQVRMAPIATTFNPGADPYDGLATCVSLNTAVAARVGTHRVTYQPNISGVPDPSGLPLRVDGVLTTLGANGLDLGSGGRVVKTSVGGIEIDFPNGTILTVTPGWWASQSKWYLNVDVLLTPSLEGIMGAIMRGSWLPALPDGTSLGPMPAALHQRYVDLYQKFGNAWRVTDETSLFDYAPGTSTATFTLKTWPLENPPCVVPETRPVKPVSLPVAELACRGIKGKNMHADCVFDVRVTGNPGFAKTYLLSQRIQAGSTTTIVTDDEDPTQVGEWVTFTAIVAPNASASRGIPIGTVQFTLDGTKVGEPVKLDSKGRATWETPRLKVGKHRVGATYIPSQRSVFLPSSSLEKIHTVRRCPCVSVAGDR
jgi:hypothetical protein